MKAILILPVIAALFLRLAVERPPRDQHVHKPLAKGGMNLVKIGCVPRIGRGAPIIFRTNYSAAGVVKAFAPSVRFDDGEIAPAIQVRWHCGATAWVKLDQLRNAYTTEAR